MLVVLSNDWMIDTKLVSVRSSASTSFAKSSSERVRLDLVDDDDVACRHLLFEANRRPDLTSGCR